jgi:hypothetical protein
VSNATMGPFAVMPRTAGSGVMHEPVVIIGCRSAQRRRQPFLVLFRLL